MKRHQKNEAGGCKKLIEKVNLKEELINKAREYVKRIKRGERISKILASGDIDEDSFSEEGKAMLDLYREKECSDIIVLSGGIFIS